MKRILLVLLMGMLMFSLLYAVPVSAENTVTRSSSVGDYTHDECENCNGNGTITQSYSCSYCSGSGTIKNSCTTCGGDGENGYTTETKFCSVCKGTGQTTKTNYTQTTCSSCSGVGRYKRCGICGMTLSSYQTSCYSCSYGVVNYINCSSCNGSGTKYVASGTITVACTFCDDGYVQTKVPKKCTTCSGSGKISSDCSQCENGKLNSAQTCSSCSGSGFKPYSTGDIDGYNGVTDADAVYLFRHTLYPERYSLNQNCDFNGDGKVNDKDAAHLLYYTFLPDSYPIS